MTSTLLGLCSVPVLTSGVAVLAGSLAVGICPSQAQTVAQRDSERGRDPGLTKGHTLPWQQTQAQEQHEAASPENSTQTAAISGPACRRGRGVSTWRGGG